MNFLEWLVEKAGKWILAGILILVCWGLCSSAWSSWESWAGSRRGHNRELVDGMMRNGGVSQDDW